MRSPRPACGCSATLLLSTSSRTSQDLFPCRTTTPHSQSKVLWRSGIRMIAEGRVEAEGFFFRPLALFPPFIILYFDAHPYIIRWKGNSRARAGRYVWEGECKLFWASQFWGWE